MCANVKTRKEVLLLKKNAYVYTDNEQKVKIGKKKWNKEYNINVVYISKNVVMHKII